MELTIITGAWMFDFTETIKPTKHDEIHRTRWVNLLAAESISFRLDEDNNPIAVIKSHGLNCYTLRGDDCIRLKDELAQIKQKQVTPRNLVIL